MSKEEERRKEVRNDLCKSFKELREKQGIYLTERQVRKTINDIADRVDNKRRDTGK